MAERIAEIGRRGFGKAENPETCAPEPRNLCPFIPLPMASAAPAVDEAHLRALVFEQLEQADLATCSERMIRTQLEASLGHSLKHHKAVIRGFVEEYLSKDDGGGGGGGDDDDDDEAEEEKEEEPAEKESKKRKVAFGVVILSTELASFFEGANLPHGEMGRAEVVKHLWAYFKAHNLQNPKNKRQIIPDEALARVFGPKGFDAFKSLPKLISKHVFHTTVNGQSQLTSTADEKRKAKKPKAANTKKPGGGGGGGGAPPPPPPPPPRRR